MLSDIEVRNIVNTVRASRAKSKTGEQSKSDNLKSKSDKSRSLSHTALGYKILLYWLLADITTKLNSFQYRLFSGNPSAMAAFWFPFVWASVNGI